MKVKILMAVFLILFMFSGLQAQVLENAGVLRSGKMNLGVFLVDFENDDMGIFVQGGYGLGPGYDLDIQLGLGYSETYIGADIEWLLKAGKPAISVTAGAHSFGDIGLDGTLNLTFPLNRQVDLYTGLDLDVNFVDVGDEKETMVPIWVPLGVEIAVGSKIDLLFEFEIDVNDDAWTIVGGGVNFSF
jgi:hypothetical protein